MEQEKAFEMEINPVPVLSHDVETQIYPFPKSIRFDGTQTDKILTAEIGIQTEYSVPKLGLTQQTEITKLFNNTSNLDMTDNTNTDIQRVLNSANRIHEMGPMQQTQGSQQSIINMITHPSNDEVSSSVNNSARNALFNNLKRNIEVQLVDSGVQVD